jgi:hypothetical protein
MNQPMILEGMGFVMELTWLMDQAIQNDPA